MKANKKLGITLIVLCSTLLLAVLAIVIVLVATAQTASSAVSIKYKAENVEVRIQANAHLPSTSHAFTANGTRGGATSIDLTKDNPTGVLSQPTYLGDLILDENNEYIIYEYIFTNLSDISDAKISLINIPGDNTGETITNVKLSYAYSSTQVSDFTTLTKFDYYSNQLLPAYSGENPSIYIYIVVNVKDLLYSATMKGQFVWDISLADESEITTYNLDLTGVDLAERNLVALPSSSISNSTLYKTFANSENFNIDIVPVKKNTAFLGWSTTSGATTPDVISCYNNEVDLKDNIIRSSSVTTLYPVFKAGTVPSTSYSYSNGEYIINSTKITSSIPDFVIPDYFDNDTNGLAKVAIIADGDAQGGGVLNNNTYVTKITIGRNINSIGSYAFYKTTNVTQIDYLATNVANMPSANKTFAGCGINGTGITLNVYPNVITLPDYIFGSFDTTTYYTKIITINFMQGSNLQRIGNSSLSACFRLVNISTMWENCKILETIDDLAFYNTDITNIVLPASVTKLGSANPFGAIRELVSISVQEGNKIYESRANCNVIMEKSTKTLISGCVTSIIPNDTIVIGKRAFQEMILVTLPNIPSTVVKIDAYAFGSNSLTSGISIPDTVLEIGTASFYGSQATEINLGSGLARIGASAFAQSKKVTSITIPSSANMIQVGCFTGCTNLQSIVFEDTNGWFVGTSSNPIYCNTPVDVSDAQRNITLFTVDYINNVWHNK